MFIVSKKVLQQVIVEWAVNEVETIQKAANGVGVKVNSPYNLYMTIGEHLMNIAEAGITLAHDRKDEKDVFGTLAVLLDLEDSLDKGRALVGTSGRDHLPSIYKKLELLRKEIDSIIHGIPPSDVKKFLEGRGEILKTQWFIK